MVMEFLSARCEAKGPKRWTLCHGQVCCHLLLPSCLCFWSGCATVIWPNLRVMLPLGNPFGRDWQGLLWLFLKVCGLRWTWMVPQIQKQDSHWLGDFVPFYLWSEGTWNGWASTLASIIHPLDILVHCVGVPTLVRRMRSSPGPTSMTLLHGCLLVEQIRCVLVWFGLGPWTPMLFSHAFAWTKPRD